MIPPPWKLRFEEGASLNVLNTEMENKAGRGPGLALRGIPLRVRAVGWNKMTRPTGRSFQQRRAFSDWISLL